MGNKFTVILRIIAVGLVAFQITGCNDTEVKGNKLNSSPVAQELDALAAKPNMNELNSHLASINDPEYFVAAMDWQKEQFINGKGGARTAFMYAYNLYRGGIKDTATMAYISGVLQARVDGARCKDKTGVARNIYIWEKQLTPAMNTFEAMDEDAQKKIIRIALGREEKTKSRAPDEWICSGGISFFTRFNEKHRDNPDIPIESADDPSNIGKTMVYDDPEIKPEFVTHDEWEKRRAEILENFSESVLKSVME